MTGERIATDTKCILAADWVIDSLQTGH